MPDDLKLSVDVEASLSKLDMSLENAVKKCQTAGQKMQGALNVSGGGGSYQSPGGGASFGGNGLQQVTGLNTQNVTFGGTLNAVGGNGQQGFTPPAASGLKAIAQQISALSKTLDEAKLGAKLAVAGLALDAALTVGNSAGYYSRAFSTKGVDEVQSVGFLAKGEQGIRNIPIVGNIVGAGFDLSRSIGRYAGRRISGWGFKRIGSFVQDENFDPQAEYQGESEARTLGQVNARGFKGGGYYGDLKQLSYDQFVTNPEEIRNLRVSGASKTTIDSLRVEQARDFLRRFSENQFDRSVDLFSLNSQTKELNLRTAGLSKAGDFEAIKRDYDPQIALARQQQDPQREAALRNLQRATLANTLFSGLQGAQAVDINGASLGPGSVRMGSLNNQPAKVTSYLARISRNTDGPQVPVIGRN